MQRIGPHDSHEPVSTKPSCLAPQHKTQPPANSGEVREGFLASTTATTPTPLFYLLISDPPWPMAPGCLTPCRRSSPLRWPVPSTAQLRWLRFSTLEECVVQLLLQKSRSSSLLLFLWIYGDFAGTRASPLAVEVPAQLLLLELKPLFS